MIQDLRADEYNMELEKQKIGRNLVFAVSRLMKVFFYLAKVLMQIAWGVVRTVLKTFGVPIGN